MDRELIEQMADSAMRKSHRAKALADLADTTANEMLARGDFDGAKGQMELYHGYKSDQCYWLGQMNAYRGIAGALGIREIVEREMEEKGSCP